MLKLKDIKDPQFQIEVADGDVRSFDIWKVQEDFARNSIEFKDDPACTYDAVRKAFGMPLGRDATDETPTFTRHQCLEILDAMTDFIEALPVTKKASSRGQS